jgi:hypothetical protein
MATTEPEKTPAGPDSALAERIRETVLGYARTAEYLEKERRERLRRMTVEESRAIAAELDRAWEQSSHISEWRGC